MVVAEYLIKEMTSLRWGWCKIPFCWETEAQSGWLSPDYPVSPRPLGGISCLGPWLRSGLTGTGQQHNWNRLTGMGACLENKWVQEWELRGAKLEHLDPISMLKEGSQADLSQVPAPCSPLGWALGQVIRSRYPVFTTVKWATKQKAKALNPGRLRIPTQALMGLGTRLSEPWGTWLMFPSGPQGPPSLPEMPPLPSRMSRALLVQAGNG